MKLFEALLPVLVQAPPLLGHIRGRGQVQVQGRWLQGVQDLGADQGIQALARQALARRLAVVDAAAGATVAEPAAPVGVADQQVPDERQANDGDHDRHLHRSKAGEVPRAREIDGRADEEQPVRRPVDDRVEERAEA